MTLAQISRTMDQPQKTRAVWVLGSVVLFGLASAAGTYLAIGQNASAPAEMAALQPVETPQTPEVLADRDPAIIDIDTAEVAPAPTVDLAPPTAEPAILANAALEITPTPTAVEEIAELAPVAEPVTPEPAPIAIASDNCIARLDATAASLIVPFEPYATQTLPTDIAPVIDLAQRVSECDAAHLVVAGHADPSGDETQNLLLSWQRAEFVVAALTEAGFDQTRIEAIGFGSRRPLSEGAAGSDDTLNRRVDFIVRAALP